MRVMGLDACLCRVATPVDNHVDKEFVGVILFQSDVDAVLVHKSLGVFHGITVAVA